MKQQHTPVPWRITRCLDDKCGDFYIRGIEPNESDIPIAVTRAGPEKENAEFIVKAVNHHDEFLAVCKRAAAAADKPEDFIEGSCAYEALKDVIAKVEGRQS